MQSEIPLSKQITRCTLVAVAYFCLGKFGLSMPYKLSVVTLLWLPIGIAVPAVFRWGWVTLWGVAAGEMAISFSNGQTWSLAAGLAAANVTGLIAIVGLLQRLGFSRQFGRRRDVIFWCVASVLGTLVASLLGATFLCLSGILPWGAWNQAWLMWWLSDVVGLLLAGPVLMAVTRAQLRLWRERKTEIIGLVGLTALLSWPAFFHVWPPAFSAFHSGMLVLPLLVWAALRFGVVGASALALGVSILAALATALGQGTFAGMNPGAAVFSLWAFAGMAALLSLLITALEAERTQSAIALRQQERELRTLTDNLPDVIMRLDRDRRVVFINKAIEIATGLPPARFIGRTTVEAGLPVGTIPHWTDSLTRVIATGQAQHLEFEFAGPQGARHWTAQMVPELDEHAAVQSVVIIVRDTTERYHLESQLRQSQKLEAVGTLAGGIAHDFNNILTGIYGNTQLVAMDLPPASPAHEGLQRVLQASQRARDLVNQILTFSRQQEQQRSPLQLQAVVQEAMRLLRPSLPASIEIVTHLPEASPAVLANSSQLHQVLLNLATNAAQAMGEAGGRLEIRQEEVVVDLETVHQRPQLRCGQFVRLAVSDTGCGMDATTLGHIFEPFFTTKEPGTGTGLGLAVVHGIVQQHEGAVVVYSEPGKGTTFQVYLPACSAPATTETGGNLPALQRGQGECAMVVDDELIVVQVAAGILQRYGYRTAVFTDPAVALVAFRKDPEKYDVVLTDLTMPKMKGTHLAAEVRRLRPMLPIVLCTGFSGALNPVEAAGLNLHGPLLKPFTTEALVRAVATALRASRGNGNSSAVGRPIPAGV